MRLFISLIVLSFSLSSFAADGYQIKIKIKDLQKDSIFLGYHYGNKQFLRDTAVKDAKGWFTFKGDEQLECGMYLIVLPPDNKYFEVLLDENNQNFEVETDIADLTSNIKIKGSEHNILFYDYLNFIGGMRPKAEAINKKKEAAKGDEATIKKLDAELEQINNDVLNRQKEIMEKHAGSLPAAIIKANQGPNMPKFDGSEEEINVKRWRWMLEHYFDNIDLDNDCLVRTSFLFQKINYYMEKLTVQHPDSMSKSIDHILKKAKPGGEVFKYYLVHFLNKAAKSKVVGMDAVYVHLVKKYYKTGMADWTPDTTLQKIVKNADELEPTLIGKIAPEIKAQNQAGESTSLHSIKADYTVVYVWDPDCGHCKKAAPFMVEFYEKYKDKGVEMFAICSKFGKDTEKCWPDIEEKGYNIFNNYVDQYHRSKYKIRYNIKSTPQVFILDKDKKIIMKKIGAEQMAEVMDKIIEDDQKRMQGK